MRRDINIKITSIIVVVLLLLITVQSVFPASSKNEDKKLMINDGILISKNLGQSNKHISRSTSTFQYDHNGNLVDEGDKSFEYDSSDRLVKIINQSTMHETTFVYDAYGNKMSKTSDGGAIYFVGSQEFDSDANILREYVGSTLIDYTDSGDKTEGEAEILYYLKDSLNSVVALTDEAGQIVERYFYEPYGKTTITDRYGVQIRPESFYGNPFMWTGQRYDAENELYHFWARSYDPELGRWMQRDPLGYIDGMNLYEYVSSSPLNFIDPFGLETGYYDYNEIGGYEYDLIGDIVQETGKNYRPSEAVQIPTFVAGTVATGAKGLWYATLGNSGHGVPPQFYKKPDGEVIYFSTLPGSLRDEYEKKMLGDWTTLGTASIGGFGAKTIAGSVIKIGSEEILAFDLQSIARKNTVTGSILTISPEEHSVILCMNGINRMDAPLKAGISFPPRTKGPFIVDNSVLSDAFSTRSPTRNLEQPRPFFRDNNGNIVTIETMLNEFRSGTSRSSEAIDNFLDLHRIDVLSDPDPAQVDALIRKLGGDPNKPNDFRLLFSSIDNDLFLITGDIPLFENALKMHHYDVFYFLGSFRNVEIDRVYHHAAQIAQKNAPCFDPSVFLGGFPKKH